MRDDMAIIKEFPYESALVTGGSGLLGAMYAMH